MSRRKPMPPMMGGRKRKKDDSSELIKSFIKALEKNKNLSEGDYEVWEPFFYRGILGFVDLIIENEEGIGIFSFVREFRNVSDIIKEIKIQRKFIGEERGKSSSDVEANLVIEDISANIENMLENEKLLLGSNINILIISCDKDEIKSLNLEKERIKGLFRSKNIRVKEENVEKIIKLPADSERIAEGVINLKKKNDLEKLSHENLSDISSYVSENKSLPESLAEISPCESRDNERVRKIENA